VTATRSRRSVSGSAGDLLLLALSFWGNTNALIAAGWTFNACYVVLYFRIVRSVFGTGRDPRGAGSGEAEDERAAVAVEPGLLIFEPRRILVAATLLAPRCQRWPSRLRSPARR